MNPQDPNGWTTPKQKTEDRAFAENLLNELKTPARKARHAQKKEAWAKKRSEIEGEELKKLTEAERRMNLAICDAMDEVRMTP